MLTSFSSFIPVSDWLATLFDFTFVLFLPPPLTGIFLCALTKAQVISAWVTLGGGWSKFQVQSQQTVTVLRWRILSAPALWVFLQKKKNLVLCSLSKFTGAENLILIWTLLFWTDLKAIAANFVSVWTHWPLMPKISGSPILCFSVQPTLSKCETTFKNWGVLLQRTYGSFSAKVGPGLRLWFNGDRSYCLTKLLWHFPVLGLSWSLPMLKDYKNLLANSSGPPKKCQASKRRAAEFLIGSVFCLFCV